ncbi:MAG: hypothetical protein FWE57_11850 [Chitinispirillia bacterium]|nr:hypothetical protein [Chitinispirillia bacterium]
MKTTVKFTINTIIIVLGVLFVLGCSDNTAGTQTDPRAENFLNRFVDKHPLILGQGEAWVEVGTESRGFVFYEDGSFVYITLTDGVWSVYTRGTWTDKVVTLGGVVGVSYSYRIDGSVLRLESGAGVAETIILARVSGVHINP